MTQEIMNQEIMALDWTNRKIGTGVTFGDAVSIHVLVLSGDEVLTIKTIGEQEIKIDASNCRNMDWYDDEYDVAPDEFGEWSKRETSYDHLGYDPQGRPDDWKLYEEVI